MNREETLALYEQGKEAWNKWANRMLEERKRLEEAGEWDKNEYHWIEQATANFSSYRIPHKFEEEMNFKGFIFPSKVHFSKANFKNYAFFDNSIFHDRTDFQESIFKSTVNFTKATFNGPALFNNCEFKGLVSFHRCLFNDNLWFGKTNFKEYADFELSQFNKKVSFLKSNFLRNSNFKAITCASAFSLERTFFQHHVPNFDQAHFIEAPRLDNIKFGDDVAPGNFKNSITTFIHPDIKARYQALKRLAIQAHDHENEQRFWAGELRSSRSLKKVNGKWNWDRKIIANCLVNVIYESLSNFGRSIFRPLGIWFFAIIIMTTIHFYAQTSHSPIQMGIENIKMKIQMSDGVKLDTCTPLHSALHLAFKKAVFGLGQDASKRSIYVRDYTCLYGTYNDKNKTPKIPEKIFWIEQFQQAFSAILIFLTLLGIRNNFKLK